ncbi:hypothetical protein ACOSP7_009683 [Xanthoceras sorbifolium]
MEQKAEIDNLLKQVSVLMEKCETIFGDAVVQTKVELIKEYKEGKVEHWNPEKDFAVWEEIQALTAAEAGEVEGVVGEGDVMPSTVNDAQAAQVEIDQRGRQEDGDQQQQT